ncbi:MAG: UbiH/UbiF/VisC/COQ6 family ubiquinone biosynthesis hydroxylase [Gammaproteobacteria bacterium]
MNKKVNLDADVIIVGGGLVGCTLAALLAKQDIRCLIVEANKGLSMASHTLTDPRALAITRASENILHTAGAWTQLPEDKIGHFREMHVWDENGSGEIHFDSADLCESTLGYIIEQTILEAALHEALEQLDCIEWCRPATPVTLIQEKDKASITLEDDRKLSASLVVGADGARSKIRALAGIDYPQRDYHQQAVACVIKTERPHGQVARQRFLNNGPLAFLPMADPQQCGIVWSTLPDHADSLLAMDEQEFEHTLGQAFDDTLGEVLFSGPRVSFPLQHAQAESYCQLRLALVGDAAHSVHPLAGQGANLGLLDAATLAEVILEANNKNRDIGAYAVLRRYERWRKGENLAMLKLLQGFKYLFESKLQGIRRIRNLGLDLTDKATPLKHLIMRHAMGLAGDLPAFAREQV